MNLNTTKIRMFKICLFLCSFWLLLELINCRICANRDCTIPLFVIQTIYDFASNDTSFVQFSKGEKILIFSVSESGDMLEGKVEDGRQGFLWANQTKILENFNKPLEIVEEVNLYRILPDYKVFIENQRRKLGQESKIQSSNQSADEINEKILQKLEKNDLPQNEHILPQPEKDVNVIRKVGKLPRPYINAEKINLDDSETDIDISFSQDNDEKLFSKNQSLSKLTHIFEDLDLLVENEELKTSTIETDDFKGISIIKETQNNILNDLNQSITTTVTLEDKSIELGITPFIITKNKTDFVDEVEVVIDKRSQIHDFNSKNENLSFIKDIFEDNINENELKESFITTLPITQDIVLPLTQNTNDLTNNPKIKDITKNDISTISSNLIDSNEVDIPSPIPILLDLNNLLSQDTNHLTNQQNDNLLVSQDNLEHINKSNNTQLPVNESKMVYEKYNVCKPVKTENGKMVRDPLCSKYMSDSVLFDEDEIKDKLHMERKKFKRSFIFRFLFLWMDGISRLLKDASLIYKQTFLFSNPTTSLPLDSNNLVNGFGPGSKKTLETLAHENTKILVIVFFSICGFISLFLGVRKSISDVNQETFEALSNSYENYKMAQDYRSLNAQNEKKICDLEEMIEDLQSEVSNLRQRNMEDQMKVRRESSSHIESQLLEYKNKIVALKSIEKEYNDIAPAFNDLKIKKASLHQQLNHMESKYTELQDKFNVLQNEFDSRNMENEKLKAKLIEMEENSETLHIEKEMYKRETENLKSLLEKLEIKDDADSINDSHDVKNGGKLIQKLVETAKLVNENETLQEKVLEFERLAKRHTEEVKDLKNLITKKELETSSAKNELKAMELRNKEFEGKIAYISQYFNDKECNMQRTISELNSDLERNKKEYKFLERKYDNLNKQRDLYLENLDDSRKDIIDIQRDSQKRINELEGTNYKLQSAAFNFEKRTNSMQLEINSFKNMLNDIENRLENFNEKANNKEIESQLNELKAFNRNFAVSQNKSGGQQRSLNNVDTDYERAFSECESFRSSSKSNTIEGRGTKKMGKNKNKSVLPPIPGLPPFIPPFFMPPPPPHHIGIPGGMTSNFSSSIFPNLSATNEITSKNGNVTDSCIISNDGNKVVNQSSTKTKSTLNDNNNNNASMNIHQFMPPHPFLQPPPFNLYNQGLTPLHPLFVVQSENDQSTKDSTKIKKKKKGKKDAEDMSSPLQFNVSGIGAHSSPITTTTTTTTT